MILIDIDRYKENKILNIKEKKINGYSKFKKYKR